MKIVVVSGGFDPIHSGHIEYIKAAKSHGDFLVVALNSDKWLEKKKGKFFMPFDERFAVISNLVFVNKVISFEDDEYGGCINGLEKIKLMFPDDEIIFCNGGDRSKENIPEMKVPGISFLFGVGGNNKINSSSSILKEWTCPNEERIWGKFYNLFQETNLKIKELIVDPGKGMSFQRHFVRNEVWFISKGACRVNFSDSKPDAAKLIELKTEDIFQVKAGCWHQIINPYDEKCHIIEIQYGEETIEDDIERLYLYEKDT
tara:strand:- start:344 stop:1120 length:777 start_codon:yes stop_codon:yes gene_type:complete